MPTSTSIRPRTQRPPCASPSHSANTRRLDQRPVFVARRLLLLLLLIPCASAQTILTPIRPGILTGNFAFSDDAKDVYFAAGVSPDGVQDTLSNLYHYDAAAHTTTKLTNFKTDGGFLGALGVHWVAYPGSGTRIAYTLIDPASPNDDQVRLLDTATGADRLLETYKDNCPRPLCVGCYSTCITALHMTRDGTVVYAAAGKDHPFHVLKPDSAASAILPVDQGSLAQSGQRTISANGKVVFISSGPNGPITTAQATYVYTMDLDGSNIQQLTHLGLPQYVTDATISADGSQIAFAVYEGPALHPEIWSIRTDGSQLHRLSIDDTDATNPSISADGKSVTFIQDGQVKRMTTVLDVPLAALIQPYPITHLSTSQPTSQTISGDGQQAAVALNGASINLASTAPATPIATLTRVFAPRVLYSVRSAAGYASPSVGSLITAYGANLADEELTVAPSFPFPTTLGNVQLSMNGAALPLQATTPWQINAQIPQSVRPGDVSFVAQGGDRNATTPELHVTISAADPEAIRIPGPTTAQAAAVYPGTAIVADQDHPAAAGQILELYAIGLGVTTPPVAAGAASPVNPPAIADVQPRLQLGNREVEILFAGLAPGLAGVYQVNFRVPSGLSPGLQLLEWLDASGRVPTGAIIAAGIYVK